MPDPEAGDSGARGLFHGTTPIASGHIPGAREMPQRFSLRYSVMREMPSCCAARAKFHSHASRAERSASRSDSRTVSRSVPRMGARS